MTGRPPILPLGDSAFLLRFGPGGEDAARAAAARLRGAAGRGLREVVVAWETVAVHFDPVVTTAEELARFGPTGEARGPVPPVPEPVLHTVPVRYDGEDLEWVAASCGLTRAQVVELHAAGEYRVQAVGFVPGFAYLGELDERLRLPRRDAPRPRVPAGAVAIAGAQTAVYPFATPGGWHLIGRTELTLFDPRRDPAALLAVGARVRFVPARP